MQKINQTYYAHGKLLLTAEYFVLYGAKAIALPLCFGQRMDISENTEGSFLSWKAFMKDELWFSCEFSIPDLQIIRSSNDEKALLLKESFQVAKQLNPAFDFNKPLSISNHLDFDYRWGLGSSSTLMANLAAWAQVDPFRLNELVFNGSGFDIACAKADGPVFYKRGISPIPVNLDYSFKDHLFLVYSGVKKSTRNEVRRFLKDNPIGQAEVDQMNELTHLIAESVDLTDFMHLIKEHEELVASVLGIDPVQKQYFSDFNGQIKSLGAWGGDFYLVSSPMEESSVFNYFRERGHNVIFKWDQMILTKH